VTPGDRDKFATYYRDGTTGLDYAQNRYYSSTLGRFITPDPYMASAGAASPQSWNRYTYVSSGPIRYYDPGGLLQCDPEVPTTQGNEDTCQRTTLLQRCQPLRRYLFLWPSEDCAVWRTDEPVEHRRRLSQYNPYAVTEQYTYTQAGLMTTKSLALTADVSSQSTTLRTANLDTSQTYDNVGRPLAVTYPDGKTYTTAYDGMGRPVSLVDNQPTPVTWVNNVRYGISGELLQISYAGYTESRTYNSRLQLTSVGTIQYSYSPNHNNGQITQQLDSVSGEQVTYTYDSLQRLISAVTTDPSWGQGYTYDGFGNLTGKTQIKGYAPQGNWFVDASTNRVSGNYDPNGNLLTATGGGNYTYDVDNRLVVAPFYTNGGYTPEIYAYAPDNKRIYKRMPDGTEELYFYGITGQKLGTYRPFIYQYGISISTVDTNLYFGSRTIVSRGVTVVPDRLGSNRAGGSRYFPYGEEQQVTAQDRDKFATYYRDGTTGLDYAQNRYYASTLGRFISPDPYSSSVGPADPGSWNRYAYVQNDPINFADPTGAFRCTLDGIELPDCWPLRNAPSPEGPWCDSAFLPGQDPACGGQGGGIGGGPTPPPPPPTPRPRPARPPSPEPECFAQLKYRDVDDPRAKAVGATHSFWWVQDSTGAHSIISGGPQQYEQGGRQYLALWVTPGDYSQTSNDNKDQKLWWSSGLSSTICDQVARMISAAKSFSNRSFTYDALFGPNSNSAAHYLAGVAGFNPSSPPGAFGWDFPILVP
jgi:RHS repeat-associated protein